MKKSIKYLVTAVIIAIIVVSGYFYLANTFSQLRDAKAKLDQLEVQWAIKYPEQVLKAKESYELIHKSADEVYFGILEQGKE
jgi:hypothetical protein